MKIFGNKGKLDPRAFTMFGISVKETDNPIGYFGTGLKYAIAVCMREKLEFRIVTGGESYTFYTDTMGFRDKDFEVIKCDITSIYSGREIETVTLPFTTELGKNWGVEQAYRELASNCMDEGGTIGDVGETTIYADLDVQHNKVFLDTTGLTVLEDNEELTIYDSPASSIFYKGIKVHEARTRFTYNLKRCRLTEDRTIHGLNWNWERPVAYWVAEEAPADILRLFITRSLTLGDVERGLDFNWVNINPSDAFKEFIKNNPVPDLLMNTAAWELANKKIAGTGQLVRVEPTEVEERTILNIVDSLGERGIDCPYKIVYVAAIADGSWAAADIQNKVIYLRKGLTDEYDFDKVGAILLEEITHIETGFSDCTRQLQNYLFEQYWKLL